ncbi:MAG: hypothetical protein GY721_00920 [Deltaproteobacteria bacterium]|nr:hypothetical protein [Deltaproteobacteria bacterium]
MIKRTLCAAAVVLLGLLVFSQSVHAETALKPAIGLTAQWESKYVSEGRDNLSEGGIFSFEATAELQGFTTGAWYASGYSESYEELNLFIEYGADIRFVSAYVGYTRLEFLETDTFDNELGVGLAINNIPHVVPSLDYVYSTESEGAFVEFSLSSELVLLEERVTLEPYILEGFDFGYATPDFDGVNNLQVGINVTIAAIERVSLVGSANHSWAHEDVDNEDLGDKSWVSLGLSAEF